MEKEIFDAVVALLREGGEGAARLVVFYWVLDFVGFVFGWSVFSWIVITALRSILNACTIHERVKDAWGAYSILSDEKQHLTVELIRQYREERGV